jgi:Protein of unknown function (DUF3551)
MIAHWGNATKRQEADMIRILAGVGVVAAMLTAGVQPSSADPRPYCLQGGKGASGGGLPDCTYHTWEQCRAAVGGGADACYENPALAWRARERGYVQPAPRRQSRERY